MRAVLALLAAVAWLGWAAPVRAAEPVGGTALRWAGDAEGGAPFIFKDPAAPDRHQGFEVDIAHALARELGRPIDFMQYEYQSLDVGLLRGDFDFAMNGIEVTPDRVASLLFTRPYYVYEQQLVIRRDEKRIATVDDLTKIPGLEVGTLRDTAAERLLAKLGVRIRGYDGQAEPYVDLARGETDAVLLDVPIALYYGRQDPKIVFSGPPVAPGTYGIAFRPGNEVLRDQVDAALGRVIASGELRRILENWELWTPAQAALSESGGGRDVLAESRAQWTFGVVMKALLQGASITIEISVKSMLLAILIGLPLALLRLYGPAPLRWFAIGYVEFFRGIPVLLLLFFLYYGLPQVAESIGLPMTLALSPMTAAVLGFGLNYGAFEAEIYRAGIASVPKGQWEAAASLGMPPPLAFRRVILPQSVRTILPPMTNDFVALFKDTSVVSVITVAELTKTYQILSKSSLKYVEIGLLTALLYLLMSVPLGWLSRRLEERWSRGAA